MKFFNKICLSAMGSLLLLSSVANADIVHSDDVIIQFSGCVGNDCVNGESFGFDTLRLKENNLRMHFDDTSSSASFPSNDWRIVANDSSNGGSNYLGIEDSTSGRIPFRVEAGAPVNALYVEADGDVGIKTSNPVVDLHIVEGNTPTVRLEQDGSDGFTPQTWDMAGNEANFFIRDVTNGSTIPFRIFPSAPSNSISIASDGGVGIGISTPRSELHVRASGSAFTPNAIVDLLVQNNSTSGQSSALAIVSGATGSSSIGFGTSAGANTELDGRIRFVNSTQNMEFYANTGFGSPVAMTIDGDGASGDILTMIGGARLTAGGVWTDASSRTLKQDIVALSSELAHEAFSKLNPMSYTYKRHPDETYLGFIAEDVPELVAMEDRKSLSPMDIVALLTKVVQDQQSKISELSERLSELEN